ncbi:hypothetical protein QCA50_000841 [Cerrena zonata]|uniref:NADH dehydrogenase [ubiquinone] 1 alpha subcomplex assembly factor 3 n=1 Tax=Cerrena zonata TaxID=2478898 RepID=A0AAW0H069_9APHY
MFSRTLAHSVLRQSTRTHRRCIHQTAKRLSVPTSLNNILAGGEAPAVLINTVSQEGIQLADGLVIPSACIFLEGKTFLWDVPPTLWDKWTPEHFEIFDVVVPKPELLLLGTGPRVQLPPSPIRQYLAKIGVQVDFMDTKNACSTYNLLTEEGRRVAAALLPLKSQTWGRNVPPQA